MIDEFDAEPMIDPEPEPAPPRTGDDQDDWRNDFRSYLDDPE
jgi:hypothetical protein